MKNVARTVKIEELRRRVEVLANEVSTWRNATREHIDFNAHFSQLEALETLMNAYVAGQRAMLAAPPASDSALGQWSENVVAGMNTTQRVWDFFRSKLELRLVSQFKKPLAVADAVGWDCYASVMKAAVAAGAIDKDEVREPPLTYLAAEFSPATWVRGSRPHDGRDYQLGVVRLPIPVIEVPWDHVVNLWEFLSIHHEVGHDIEADLLLRPALRASVEQALADAGATQDRIALWQGWQGEVFADLVALQLAGPAFAEALMDLLLLPATTVLTVNPADPHPTHYPRVLMAARYARTLVSPVPTSLEETASRVETTWRTVYGFQPAFDATLDEFTHVAKALMDTPFDQLKGKTVRELMPFTAEHESRIGSAAAYLVTGTNAPAALSLLPRHCVSAARLAISRAAADAAVFPELAETINQRTQGLVEKNTPEGVRGPTSSTRHAKFVASFVNRISL